MKPLKIALLKSTSHCKGGLEKYCSRLAKAFQERRHHVSILTSLSKNSTPLPLTTCICSRIFPSFLHLLWFDFWARRFLKKHHFDVVFGFDRHFLPLTHYRAGNGCHKAYLERRKKESSLFKRVLLLFNPLHWLTLLTEYLTFVKRPTKVILNSHLVYNEVLTFWPEADEKKLFVILNGVEWHEFSDAFQRKQEKTSTGKNILFVGHEWQRKGLDVALRALSHIQEDFYLTVIGKERDPEYYKTLAETLKISHRVTFHPVHADSKLFYEQCDILLLPTRYDPFANVTIEAIAMGLCVVTTQSNGAAEIVQEGKNGFCVPECPSEEELVQAIKKALLFMKDPSNPLKIRDSVSSFDFSKQLSKIVDLVEK